MARNPILQLRCDCSQVCADLKSLSEAAERSLQLRERLLRLGDLGRELVCFDVDDCVAAGTSDLWIRLQPTDLLRELVATARAGEFDGLVVQKVCHG